MAGQEPNNSNDIDINDAPIIGNNLMMSDSSQTSSLFSSPVIAHADEPIIVSDDDNSGTNNANANNNQINLNLQVRSTVCFKTKKTDTIRKIKQICSKEGVTENLLNVFHDDELLEDDRTVGSYGLDNNSNLSVVIDTTSADVRKLSIRVPTHPHLNTEIRANVNDTIELIKSVTLAKVRLEPSHYELMYEGRFLDKAETLRSLGLGSERLFYLIDVPKEIITITVIAEDQSSFTFQVKKLQTIGEAKTVVGSMMHEGVDNACLMLEGKDLDEGRTFESYNIHDNTVFELLYPFKIFVKLEDGSMITVGVLPTDHVTDLNRKVLQTLMWPSAVYCYFFEGVRIRVGFNIACFGIRTDCTIHMGPCGCY